MNDLTENNRVTPKIDFTEDTSKAINRAAYEITPNMNNEKGVNEKGVLGYVLSGTGGGSAVGICAKVLLVTAGTGLGVSLFAALGIALGAGVYHII